MDVNKFRSSIVRVTPTIANQYLALNTYAGQRPIKRSRIKAIETFLKNKTWRGNFLVLATYGKTTVLLNGQNTLTYIVESGQSLDLELREYSCASGTDFSKIFEAYDEKGGRSIAETGWATAADLNMYYLERTHIAPIVAALSIVHYGIRYTSVSAAERVHLLKMHQDECLFLSRRYLDRQTCKFLIRPQVLSAIVKTYAVAKSPCQKFWDQVRDGLTTERTAAFELREKLKTSVVAASNTIQRNSSVTYMSSHQMHLECLLHWNAFRTGESVVKYRKTMETVEPV